MFVVIAYELMKVKRVSTERLLYNDGDTSPIHRLQRQFTSTFSSDKAQSPTANTESQAFAVEFSNSINDD